MMIDRRKGEHEQWRCLSNDNSVFTVVPRGFEKGLHRLWHSERQDDLTSQTPQCWVRI